MMAMSIYCIFVMALAVFSPRASAQVFVCQRMPSEVGLSLFAFFGVITRRDSAVSMLDDRLPDLNGVHAFSDLF